MESPTHNVGRWLDHADTAGDRRAIVDVERDLDYATLCDRTRRCAAVLRDAGGENVYPAEIENAFAEHPAVREVAVIGILDAKWGETGRAYVVPAEEIELDIEALLDWASERLARFKLPSEFVVVDSLPRTASGKVQKHRLTGINSR